MQLRTALMLSVCTALTAQVASATTSVAGAQVVVAPVLTLNPNPNAPMIGTLTLATDVPTRIMIVIQDGVRPNQRVLAEPIFKTNHSVRVMGLHADTVHQIRIEIIDQAGVKTVWPVTLPIVTPPLPASFPPIDVTVANTALMEPGVTLFDASTSTTTFSTSYLVIVDKFGEPIWYYNNVAESPRDVKRLRNGNFIFQSGRHMVEIDMYGNHLQEWYPTGLGMAGIPPTATLVATDTFHHEVAELPEGEQGDFLTLSSELRTFANYPFGEVDTSGTTPFDAVIGDIIVEFQRDGTITRETKLFDILDPYRITYDSLSRFWNLTYQNNTRDWAHGNAVFIDTSDNTYVVSLRHQDAIVKLNRDTGQIVWILGSHDRWIAPWDQYLLQPIYSGVFSWPFHMHGPHFNTIGQLVMWDNGNRRAIPPDPGLPMSQWYSRAVEYKIDPVLMTVKQMWIYGALGSPDPSTFLGEADPQPVTKNVIVTDGAKGLPPAPPYARVCEVTHGRPPIPVFEIVIRDQSPTAAAWTAYRSERLKSIYPD